MVNVKRSEKSTARHKEIGRRLAILRENKGLSLSHVAKRLDPPVTFQTLQKWEAGRLGFALYRIEQLVKIYHADLLEVLGYR